MVRVLYLEDEEDLANYLPALLKDRGIEVISTSSIEEAMRLFREEVFDAVLLDIMMEPPEEEAEETDYGRETGILITQKMKKMKPNLPIVAFTVLSDNEMCNRMRQAGIKEIVNKPCELDKLVSTLMAVTRPA